MSSNVITYYTWEDNDQLWGKCSWSSNGMDISFSSKEKAIETAVDFLTKYGESEVGKVYCSHTPTSCLYPSTNREYRFVSFEIDIANNDDGTTVVLNLSEEGRQVKRDLKRTQINIDGKTYHHDEPELTILKDWVPCGIQSKTIYIYKRTVDFDKIPKKWYFE